MNKKEYFNKDFVKKMTYNNIRSQIPNLVMEDVRLRISDAIKNGQDSISFCDYDIDLCHKIAYALTYEGLEATYKGRKPWQKPILTINL